MHLGIAVLSVALSLATPSYNQNNVEVENDLAHHSFYVDFASRGQLELRIRLEKFTSLAVIKTESSSGWEADKGSIPRICKLTSTDTAVLVCWRLPADRATT
jgi:hypothetical protein